MIKFYTSCYKKMLKRHKNDNDVYVKVSKNLWYPNKNVDGIFMKDLIDADMGYQFAPRSELDYYKLNLSDDELDDFVNCFEGVEEDLNVFLLCFEDLDSCYTKADEKRFPNDPSIVAGEKKTCHRTLLAEVLNDRYNLGVTEYSDDK